MASQLLSTRVWGMLHQLLEEASRLRLHLQEPMRSPFTGASGTTPATDSVQITVLDEPDDAPPTINSFTAPSSIDFGDSVTLAWTTTDATSVEIRVRISGLTIDTLTGLSVNGSTTYTPGSLGTINFQLRATNAEGTTTDSESVTVNLVLPLPTIDSFSVSPTTIDVGDSVMISWETSDATSVLVERGAVTPFGTNYATLSTSPSGSTTYTPPNIQWRAFRIQATSSGGTVTQTRTITINNP